MQTLLPAEAFAVVGLTMLLITHLLALYGAYRAYRQESDVAGAMIAAAMGSGVVLITIFLLMQFV